MRILVVEDEKNLARALVKLLEGQKYQAEAVHTGPEGLHYALSGQYDAVVLDVMLPGMDGMRVARTLRQQQNFTPILMLTARDDVRDKVNGLDSGADDYLTKPFTQEELLARIRSLLRRPAAVAMDVLTFEDIELNINTSTLSKGEKQLRLSQKELEVLSLLMRNPRVICSKSDLISRVWGNDSDAVDNNVEAYISFLRKKLYYLGSGVQIVSQRRLGYTLEGAPC